MHATRHVLLALAAVTSLAACGGRQDADDRSATPPGDTRGPIAARVEAQASFDSALAALAHGDSRASAGQLRQAASFYRAHPDAATSTARGALSAVALDLDRLADEVEAVRERDTAALSKVFARAQLADAEHHRGRSVAAWTAHDPERAGEELTLAIDHLERAMCDGRRTQAPAMLPKVREARAVAIALLAGVSGPQVGAQLEAVGAEIRRLDTLLRSGAG